MTGWARFVRWWQDRRTRRRLEGLGILPAHIARHAYRRDRCDCDVGD